MLLWKHVEGKENNKNQKTGKGEMYRKLSARGIMFKMRRRYA